MNDFLSELCQIIASKLQEEPQAELAQLLTYLEAEIAANSKLAAALNSDRRMIQLNQGDTNAFQTLVEGGIAYIGTHHLHIDDGEKFQAVLEEFFRQKQPTGIPQNLPYSGTLSFVGRTAELERLDELLQNSEPIAITALAGMGGIGKTELALQYALTYKDSYPGALCWLQVRGADLGTQIVKFGRSLLNLNPPEDLDIVAQVKYCWRNWIEGKVLIILDDIPNFSNYYKEKIIPFLPPAQSRFKVLMTSRQKPVPSIRKIDLDVLSPEASLELLRSLIGSERIEAELEEAKALCEWLGRLPLGLELVGRYLELRPTLTIVKTIERLEKRKLAAKALISQEQADMTAQLGVAAAFDLSWEDLPPKAQQLGCRLSLFAPASFDWSLVESCAIQTEDEEEREEEQEELEEIRDRFLVNRNLLQLTEEKNSRIKR